MSNSKTLAELSEESGIPARTIRFYIARGLLDGPVKAGRGAVYTAEHLARLEKIKQLQAEGRMLAEIAHDLSGGPPAQTAVPPSAWWQHVIQEDVMVWVRGDVSPWRMKQIRAAVDDIASRLREPESSNTRRNRQMSTAASFAPLVAATGKAVNLSMQRLWLTGQVLPAGARLVVQHVFRSEEDKALEVIYAFPLPRDAALRRFRITGEGFEAHSELKETEAAVKAYEEGIARGSLSTLARQYGDGVVNLTVGNIRPKETVTVDLEILCGVELRDDGFRFRFPFTLAPAYHSRAKAAVTAPGEGEMELPADEFGDVILPRFREDASALHQVGFELSIVSQLALDEIGSPSHAVRVRQDGGRSARVALAPEKDVPNRDLVLDARFQSVEPQVLAGRDKNGNGRFAAIVPSSSFGVTTEAPRRVVILLDRSGSMEGEPISQARKAIEACLGVLSETDSFGLVAFDNEVLAFQPALVSGTRESRDQAHEFLMQVDARGGTELAKGFLEAAKLLEGGGGDILILTDGQVSGTEKILADARSAGVRLHCLGIGSASQDRFLALLARETGGVSRFVTPRERVDLSAVDLFASIGRPVASGLKAGANIQPEPPSFVFGGTPVLLFGEAGETGENQIELSWDERAV